MTTLERVHQVKEQHAADLMARPGVHGVGVTMRGDDWVLCLYTDQSATPLPDEIDGVPVTTVLSGPIRAF